MGYEIDGLKLRIRVELVKGVEVVVDEDLARLLIMIERLGSILKASRALGIPYSRAWERIARAERALGQRIVIVRRGGRGGGGATLTELGRELLTRYLREYRRVVGTDLEVPKSVGIEMSVALYAGSHDLALERLVGILRERGILLEVSWTGSLCGVAALMLNEADIVGIHILDTETGTYNTTYLKSVGLGGRVAIVRGYERLQGFVTRKPMDLEHVIKKLFSGELTLINRRFGSGTRILLDYVLRTWAKKLGIDPESIPRRVRGYDDEASTHLEVAERVARGDADVGMVIAAAAKLHGLNFIPIAWERFDFAIPVDKLSSAAVSTFINVLRSSSFIEILKSLEGYRLPKDMGSIEFI